MSEIKLSLQLKIFIVGVIASLLVLLMIWAIMGRSIYDFALNTLNENDVLLLIYFSIFFANVFISYILSRTLAREEIDKETVADASLYAFLLIFIISIFIPYFTMIVIYPEIFEGLNGIEYLIAIPSVIIDFSIYILHNEFLIYIIIILLYYLVFLFFLVKFNTFRYENYNRRYDKFQTKTKTKRSRSII